MIFKSIAKSKYHICLLLSLLYILSSCSRFEELKMGIKQSPHEKYLKSLEGANLDKTAIGRLWVEASHSVFEDSLLVPLPYQEFGYFPAHEPMAAGFSISLKEGQKLLAQLSLRSKDTVNLFVDVFIKDGGDYKIVHYAQDSLHLAYEVKKSGIYFLRIQPELLQSLNYTLTLATEPILAFPVAGKDSKAIGSVWGDARGGGKRKHEGVDIFAKKGTPVVAPVDGIISRVGNNGLGGKIIMVRDLERGYSYYYAHLDSQYVNKGKRVKIFDTLGTVGNTGNAKHTPPHLHFGIYSYGAIDPFPFIYKSPEKTFNFSDPGIIGDTMRIAKKSGKKKKITVMANELATVLAVHENGVRVKMADQTIANIPTATLEKLTTLYSINIKTKTALYTQPDSLAVVKDSIQNLEVTVKGVYDNFSYVSANGIGEGWVRLKK